MAGLTSYQAIFTGAARDFSGAELGKLDAGQKLLVLGGAAATGAIVARCWELGVLEDMGSSRGIWNIKDGDFT